MLSARLELAASNLGNWRPSSRTSRALVSPARVERAQFAFGGQKPESAGGDESGEQCRDAPILRSIEFSSLIPISGLEWSYPRCTNLIHHQPDFPGSHPVSVRNGLAMPTRQEPILFWYPRKESNLTIRFRRPEARSAGGDALGFLLFRTKFAIFVRLTVVRLRPDHFGLLTHLDITDFALASPLLDVASRSCSRGRNAAGTRTRSTTTAAVCGLFTRHTVWLHV